MCSVVACLLAPVVSGAEAATSARISIEVRWPLRTASDIESARPSHLPRSGEVLRGSPQRGMGRSLARNRLSAHLSQRRRRGHANDFGGFRSRDQTYRPQDQPSSFRAQSASSQLPLFQGTRTEVRIELRKEVNQMLKLFTFVQVAADSLRRREEGQTMAEYGVVLAVITLAVIAAITLLSTSVRNAIENVATILPYATPA